MRYTLRGLFKTVTVIAVALALLVYLTSDYFNQLMIRFHLQSIGAYAVGFGPGDAISAAFHNPVESPSIARYRKIAILDFKGAHVTAESLDNLADLDLVTTMIFFRSDVRDEDLLRLKQIGKVRHLVLDDTKLTDSSVDVIAEIPGLEWVDLSNTQVTRDGMERLRAARPSIVVIGAR